MQPTNITRLRIREVPHDKIVSLYADWVLGHGEFEKVRSKRVQAGVPKTLDPDLLIEGGDFQGNDGCRIRTRWAGSRWVLDWVHADRTRPLSWHNIVDVAPGQDAGTVFIDHLAGFVGDQDNAPPPIAATPLTTSFLLKTYAGQLEPKEILGASAATLHPDDVEAWVEQIVLSPDREVGIVLVTADRDNGTLVDPEELAKRLLGTAQVFAATDQDTTWALRDALVAAGAPENLQAYGGAVRLYRPRISRETVDPLDHPLYLPRRFEKLPDDPRRRSERVGGWICAALARDVERERWLGAIVAIDMAAQQARIEQTLATPLLASPQLQAAVGTELEELRSLVAQQEVRLAEQTLMIERLRKDLGEVNTLLGDASDEIKQTADREKDALRALGRMEQERDIAFEEINDLKEELEDAYEIATPEHALQLAAKAFRDRLLILSSAVKSACDSGFRQPDLLFTALAVLAVTGGGGTAEVKSVLEAAMGKRARWRPKDSAATLNAWGKDRDFKSSTGQVVRYETHITIGHGVKPGSSMQVYYRVLDTGIVEIPWAGTHLPTTSVDG